MGKKNGKELAAEKRHKKFVQESREWNERIEKSIQQMKEAVNESASERSARRAS